MKIYTKTGDKGQTSLIGGRRVSKTHSQIEAYGTVDELMAYVGLLRDMEIAEENKEALLFILDRLMACASILAMDQEVKGINLPELFEQDISFLERNIDEMEKDLEPLNSFVLPGGHTIVSYCHIARTICRRAERNLLRIEDPGLNLSLVEQFLNRLSDYLFVLSRRIARDLSIEQIKWEPGKE
ncbi:MAG: cob(I)yrinic acid a,c-diamide adenosyltransferase [Bacteroidales bacterium]|nr:cob(I)yrinic acid a,c-diamide adenosyltransferase [Bacteroidales bacterium]